MSELDHRNDVAVVYFVNLLGIMTGRFGYWAMSENEDGIIVHLNWR